MERPVGQSFTEKTGKFDDDEEVIEGNTYVWLNRQ